MATTGYQQGIRGAVAQLRGKPASLKREHLVLVLPGLAAGGAERVANVIAEVLDRRGWRVSVISFAETDSPSYYGYPSGVEVLRLDLPPRRQSLLAGRVTALRRVLRLRRALNESAPDVVVSFLTRTNILTLLAGLGGRIPIIVSERNNPQEQPVGPIWSWLRARLYPRAFGLVTMTKGAMGCFPPDMRPREWVIPNPVLRFERRDRPPEDIKWITAVGRLVPQKGFDLLLQAFAEVAGEFPFWNLVIWGQGPERTNLEAIAQRLGLEGRVRFAGVSDSPGGWVDQADIFVMSSRFEGWGNALAEALAAEIPSISFDCRWGPGEFIEHDVNGRLVPPEDVTALARNMRELMRDPDLRRRLGTQAGAIAEAFSAESVVDEWEKVVREASYSRANRICHRGAPAACVDTAISET